MTTQEAIDYLLDPIGKREQHDEAIRMAISALEKQDVPDTNVGDMISRRFVELLAEYHDPELCTYKEYKGKPYFSIKYIENGEGYIGYGTYSPKVLSRYLREYFIEPERKTGEWISCKTQLPPTTMICHCTIQREGYLGSDVKDRSMIDLVYDETDHKWRRLSGIQLSADYRVVAWMQAAEVYGGE